MPGAFLSAIAMQNLRPDDLLQLRRHTDAMLKTPRPVNHLKLMIGTFTALCSPVRAICFFKQLLTAFWDICEDSIVWPSNNDLVYVAQQHIDILEALACQDEARASELLNRQLVESRNQIALALVKGEQKSPHGAILMYQSNKRKRSPMDSHRASLRLHILL